MTTVLWRRLDSPGLDRCVVEPAPDGFRLSGTAIVVDGDASYEIRYAVLTDRSWNTVTVGAHVQGPSGDRRMALRSDGAGSWSMGDAPLIELFGANDVDLAWTPATNTLPIRRLDLAVGASSEIVVAYVDFPGHDVSRETQRYSRLDESRYRFESDGFAATLEIGLDGLVADYEGLWDAVSWA